MNIQKYTNEVVSVSFSTRIEAPPGKLPCNGDYVRRPIFPELFNAIGIDYVPIVNGSRDREGNPLFTFKLPDYRGKFLEPVDTDATIGIQLEEDAHDKGSSIMDHSHNIEVEESQFEGDHDLVLPQPGTEYGMGTDGFAWYTEPYWQETGRSNSTSSGNHRHTITIDGVDGATETRPKNTAMPAYISAGRWSEEAVVFVPDGLWIDCPVYNELINSWDGCANYLALQNIHCYRTMTPDASAGNPTFPEAYQELARQIKLIRAKYKYVYVVGMGAGANLACMAINTHDNLATKFVGVNGVYDLTSGLDASFYTNYVDVYLGTTDNAVRTSASPSTPSIPYKVWHGLNNTVVDSSQSDNWAGANAEIKTDLPHDGNLIEYGILPEIVTFIES